MHGTGPSNATKSRNSWGLWLSFSRTKGFSSPYFSKGAIDYVKSLNNAATIVLIDGNQLAEYIYDFGVGMQLEQTIKVKKLDQDFWETMENE